MFKFCIPDITEHGPAHQSKTQITPEPVPPIRKLPQASYPLEGRQNGNHNYRKLAKPITWVTALSNSMKLWDMPRRAGPGEEFWQNVVHWRREWQTTSVFLPWGPHERYEKGKKCDSGRWAPKVGRCPYTPGKEEQRNNPRKNEEDEPMQKQCPAVDVSGGESLMHGTWNVTLGPWIKVNWM